MNGPRDAVDGIMQVMQAAFDPEFGEAWTRRQVEDAFVLGNCHFALAGPDGSEPAPGEPVAGFALSRTGFEEEELLLFAVAPQFRRRGIGKALLQRFAIAAQTRGAQRLLLEMRDGNPAESLYRAHGFVPVGRRKAYYRTLSGPRLDALTFSCLLI